MKRTKTTVKTLLVATLSLGLAAGMTSCKKEGCTNSAATNYDPDAKKDDGSCVLKKTQEEKTGLITADETWTADKIYYLQGKVVVSDGATLTIEAGTIIKGRQGQESAASALVVARGGKLMAVGTADAPIVFTSELDNIAIGQKVGSNLTRTDNELWGGVVICGKAPVSVENGDTEGNIEGINPDDGFGKYGGTVADDNSGTLAYISIRHGGISIGEGNELNALTLGGVGTGTSISNVDVYATLDDGIECFGGTVNINNALVYFQGDDGIDIDQNYSGTISNFAVIHGDGIGTDEGLEIDGPEGVTYTTGKFTLRNGICKTVGTEGTPGDFKSKAQGTVENVSFMYSTASKKAIKLRTKFVNPGSDCDHKTDAFSNLISDDLIFTAIKSDEAVTVYDGDDSGTCTFELGTANNDAQAKVDHTGAGSSFDYASAFGWTAAGQKGEL